jgi:hypothetical protein
MWVYGDRSRRLTPHAALRALTATLREAESSAPGAARHDRLTDAFLQASALAQGIADAEFAARGCDDVSPAQDAAVGLLTALGRKLAASAWSGFSNIGPPTSAELMALAVSPLPEEVEVTAPEGYAFYAVCPEAYLKAAAEAPWASPPFVIGIRSIGAGLAPLVAAVTNTAGVATVRPRGHPFRREVRVSKALRAKLAAHRGPFAIVDEGPGLSGSSFGAVADLLAELGVGPERVVFLPSHENGPGPEARPEQRVRWAKAAKRPATMDSLLADEPLAGWFEDLTGPIATIEDLSGGAWTAGRADAPPAHGGLERRKFRLRTASGVWLAKFAGLGASSEAKHGRARTLARAGACPEPLGVRRGFLLERWIVGAPGLAGDRAAIIEHVGRYLGLRAVAFPAGEDDGASLEDLAVMARTNIAELGLDPACVPAPPQSAVRFVHVDSRLHRWEWLTTADGRLIKTDALDHSTGHDLVGCQDVAWDVAGARLELGLDAAETARLCAAVAGVCDRPVDPALLAFYDVAYPAFQAGLWTLAGDERQVARYRAAVSARRPRPPSTSGGGGC